MPIDSIELRRLLRQPEDPKLDFKQEFYAIHSKGDDRHWGELIKDLLSLANGNVGYASQTGYLVIGPEDKPDASGVRKIHSIKNVSVDISQIRNKVNDACHPSIPSIELEKVSFEDDQIIIVIIKPSPHLHQITRNITTKQTQYHKGTIFIRIGDSIKAASFEEMIAIKNEKDIVFKSNQILSGIDKRIDTAQKDLNNKQEKYDDIRSKLDFSLGDYEDLNKLNRSIEFQNYTIDYLRIKKRMESKLNLSYSLNNSRLGYDFFNYAIKLIKEKIPKIPLDYTESKVLVDEMKGDAKYKLESSIENGYKKPLAYYHLMEIYFLNSEPLSAYDWGKDCIYIEHDYADLCQLHIQVCWKVIDLYDDYKEEALEYIEIERDRLRKILRVDVDEWGKPLHAKP